MTQIKSKAFTRNKLFLRTSSFFLHSLGLKVPSNIIGSNDMILSLLKFLDPVPGSHLHWTLCYRASSHGWATSTFHNRCDGKPHTVTIIRKSYFVFGGYTDIAWGENTNINQSFNSKFGNISERIFA